MRLIRPALGGCLGILLLPVNANAAGGPNLALPFWSLTPFILLLLAIAVLPLVAARFWHSNRNKGVVAAICGAPVALYLVYVQIATGQPAMAALAHELDQYAAFIVLLGSLYTVSGGIVFSGDVDPRPLNNTVLLGFGSLLANIVGTTGASLLFIRPLLRINKKRRFTGHLPVFFIFTVSNLGGLLTPLGDPPLFLGFLNGVPFHWTLRLWPEWLLSNGMVLAVFFVWDRRAYRKEPAKETTLKETQNPPSLVRGLINFPLLLGIMGAVILQGVLPGYRGGLGGPALMLGMAILSLYLTPAGLRQSNSFTWEPISEVAILFAGIFVTMIPALALLATQGKNLNITKPYEYFWLSGVLSAHLDNAPTYLTFATMAAGSDDFGLLVNNRIAGLDGPLVLQAISCGAVMMGALAYMGNGPKFMVKAIAEQAGFKMPSFFGYMAYSYAVLIPVFLAFTFLFFNPR